MPPNVSEHGEYPNRLCRESSDPFMNSASLIKAWFTTLFEARGGFTSPKIISFSSPKSTLKSGFRPCWLSSDFRRSFELLDSPFALISQMQLNRKYDLKH